MTETTPIALTGPAGSKSAGMVLSMAAMAAMFWSWWSPWPLWAVPLEIALPILCLFIVWISGGAISLSVQKTSDHRISYGFVLFPPMLGVVSSAWREFPHLTWNGAVLPPAAGVVVGGCLVALTVAALDREEMSDPLMLALSAICGAAWIAGLLILANGHLPMQSVARYPVHVADMREWHGRGGDTYTLWLAAQGQADQTSITVPARFYRSVGMGELVCIQQTTGALEVSWIDVAACPGRTAQPPPTSQSQDDFEATLVGLGVSGVTLAVALAWVGWISRSLPTRDVNLLRARLERDGQRVEDLRRVGTEWGGRSAPTYRKYEVTLSGVGKGRPKIRVIGVEVTFLSPEIKDYTPDVPRIGLDGRL